MSVTGSRDLERLVCIVSIKTHETAEEPATDSSSQKGRKMTLLSLQSYSLTYWVPFQSHIVHCDYSHLLAVIYFKAETCKIPWLLAYYLT